MSPIIGSLSFASQTDTEDDFLYVRRPMTYLSLGVYGLLFAYIYVQLWLVIKYGYKRWCYRTYVLYASIIWCTLRITLFSYYAMMEHRAAHDEYSDGPGLLSRRVGYISYFLLYSFPLYLQFSCLCLMVAYFYQIHRSSRSNFHPSELGVWRWPSYAILLANVLVLLVNIASSAVIKWQEDSQYRPLPGSVPLLHSTGLPIVTVYVVHARVVCNGLTFMAMAVALAYLTIRVANTSEARLLLETEKLTQRSAVLVCILLVFLYMCRTIINILALIPAVSFVLDTDQVDLLSDNRTAYFMFVFVLFLWEFVPTLIMVVFFRVKSPHPMLPSQAVGAADSFNASSQFLTDSISDGSTDDGISVGPHRVSFLYAGSTHHPSSSVVHNPLLRSAPYSDVAAWPGTHAPYHVSRHYDAPAPYLPSGPQYCSGNGVIDGPSGSPGHGVHSLSTKFTHRTSLFSYRILNRASRPGGA